MNTLGDYKKPLSEIFRQGPVAYEYSKEDGGYISASGYFSEQVVSDGPQIDKIKIYNSIGQELDNMNNLRAGSYRLEFYTSVNVDHQPLKSIYIDWGDGFRQSVTGIDAKSSGDPHVFYHYYSSNKLNNIIKITAYDNWNVPSLTMEKK